MTNIETKVNAMAAMILANNNEDYENARAILLSCVSEDNSKTTNDPKLIIQEILTELGAPDHLLGHPYVVEAIALVMEDRKYINNVTYILYPTIAARYDTTATRAERAIRHVIEVTFNRASLEVVEKYFGNSMDPTKGKPTNGEFIARIANVVRNRIKESGN